MHQSWDTSAAISGEYLKWSNWIRCNIRWKTVFVGGCLWLLDLSLTNPSLSCLSLNSPFFSAFFPVPPTSSLGCHTLACPLKTASSTSKDFHAHPHRKLPLSSKRLMSGGTLGVEGNRPTERFGREVLGFEMFLFYFCVCSPAICSVVAIWAPSTGSVMGQQRPSVPVLANYVADEA